MSDDKDQETEEPQPQAITKGEKQSPRWTYTFLDTTQIEAGEFILPSKASGPLAEEYADLHTIVGKVSKRRPKRP